MHYANYVNALMVSITSAIKRSQLTNKLTDYKQPVIVPEEYSLEEAMEIAEHTLRTKFSQHSDMVVMHEPDHANFFFIVII